MGQAGVCSTRHFVSVSQTLLAPSDAGEGYPNSARCFSFGLYKNVFKTCYINQQNISRRRIYSQYR